MLENENEQLSTDGNESGESSESQNEAGNEQASGKPAANEPKDNAQQPVPYDRFQEVIAQKNQFAEQTKALQAQYDTLNRQIQEFQKGQLTPKQEDALVARLKGIDPEFGGRFEDLQKKLARLDELETKVTNFENKQVQDSAKLAVTNLHEQYKVPAEMRELYNALLIQAENTGKIRTVEDIPGYFKQVHENVTKMIDGVKRTERESYVAAKKGDAQLPTSQPKGKPAVQSSKQGFSKDPETARQEIVSRYLKTAKAASDI